MEYLVRGRFVLTMHEPFGPDGIVKDGAVYVSGKNIVEAGPYNDLKARYPTNHFEWSFFPMRSATIEPGMMSRWSRTI